MPIYRFVVSDGARSCELIELANAQAARREASRIASRVAAAEPDELWSAGALRVAVEDEAGAPLFEIGLVASEAPPTPRA